MQKNQQVMYPEEREYSWQDGKTLAIGKKTLIMGILNVTPDSFSDGGKWNSVDRAGSGYHLRVLMSWQWSKMVLILLILGQNPAVQALLPCRLRKR